MFHISKSESVIFGMAMTIGLFVVFALMIAIPFVVIYALIHLFTGWTI